MTSLLQIAGLAVIAAGLWMQWPWVGVVAVGVGLLLVGVAFEVAGLRQRSDDDARESAQ